MHAIKKKFIPGDRCLLFWFILSIRRKQAKEQSVMAPAASHDGRINKYIISHLQ